MIKYETNSSPFYVANETFCLAIEKHFNSLLVDCQGYCNSWGYEFNATYIKNNITFDCRFYKDTITRNGIIIPEDSAISEGLYIEVFPFDKTHRVIIKQSKFKRLFMSKELKNSIPSPYYLSMSVSSNLKELTNWIALFKKYNMYFLNLKSGKLVIEVNNRVEEPEKLIQELQEATKFYM